MSKLKHIPKKFKSNLLIDCYHNINLLIDAGHQVHEAAEMVYYEYWKELNKWRLGAMYASFRQESEENAKFTFDEFCVDQWELEALIFMQTLFN